LFVLLITEEARKREFLQKMVGEHCSAEGGGNSFERNNIKAEIHTKLGCCYFNHPFIYAERVSSSM